MIDSSYTQRYSQPDVERRFEEIGGVPRDVILVRDTGKNGQSIEQKIEIFNPGVSDHGIVFIPGLFTIDAPRCSSGHSSNFNAMRDSFPDRQIVLAHWPTELVSGLFIANITEQILASGLTRVGYRGVCAGSAMILGLVAHNEQQGRPVDIHGISLLSPMVTTAEFQIGARIARGMALLAQRPLFASFINQEALHAGILGRVTRLPTQSYRRGSVDPTIPVQVIKTPGRRDNVIDTDASLRVLQALFNSVAVLKYKGNPLFQLKPSFPYLGNPGGSHALRPEERGPMSYEVKRFLASPETYYSSQDYSDI